MGFRYCVKNLALGFDVSGWVKNLTDGSVELQVMGEAEEVEAFVQDITEESDVAHHIKKVTVSKQPLLEGCKGFRIEA